MTEVNAAFYDPETGQVTATYYGEAFGLRGNANAIILPPGIAIDDPREWVVDTETKEVIKVGRPVEPAEVDAERDRRMVAPFEFGGHLFDRDPVSLQRITGAATLAGFAIAAGAQPGDLFWVEGATEPFAWIAADNTVVPMDAQTTFALGRAAAAVEARLVFAARALKDRAPIPADFADDKYWS